MEICKSNQRKRRIQIEGTNIWNHYWHCTDKKVEVKGPDSGNVYFFKEYQIEENGKTLNFVAGEFIDSKVGIYLKDDLSDGKF